MTIELLIGSLTLLVAILTLIYSIKENRILIEIVNSVYLFFDDQYQNLLMFDILNYSTSGIKLLGLEITNANNRKPVTYLIDYKEDSPVTSNVLSDDNFPRILLPNDRTSFSFYLTERIEQLEFKLTFDKRISLFSKTKNIKVTIK
ncbi:hypothetical protein [Streptococcus parauberis]|uniref:Conserved domain protein n=1 Tax=Streptococcus parauberis NCFD 2020 TaxID=873447 RepID=F1YY13_9STRE|nr:hypothetical protein [Streptococcus parauberis]EGE54216.1 conserved domain protein [Streptococcus parauberis NCFD 2020]